MGFLESKASATHKHHQKSLPMHALHAVHLGVGSVIADEDGPRSPAEYRARFHVALAPNKKKLRNFDMLIDLLIIPNNWPPFIGYSQRGQSCVGHAP